MKLYCNRVAGDYVVIEDLYREVTLTQYIEGAATAIVLNRDNVKQLVATLLKYLDKPPKVDGWVNVYEDGSISKLFPSEDAAKHNVAGGGIRQAQVMEIE